MHADLVYAATARVPTIAANNVHIMNMVGELNRAGAATVLLARRASLLSTNRKIREDCVARFGDVADFDFVTVPYVRGLKDRDFRFLARRTLRRLGVPRVYSRSIDLALLACAERGVQEVVLELHEPPLPTEVAAFEWMCAHPKLRAFVTITQALRDFVVAEFGVLKPVLVLHDAVTPWQPDPEGIRRFRSRIPGLAADQQYACYAGHLYEGRADTIIECAAKMPAVTFVFAGGFPEDVLRVRSRCESAGVHNAIFVGHLNQSELRHCLNGSSVLLMPYTQAARTVRGTNTSAWMSPLKMFEYMSSGVPFVSSDLPVLREVLNEDNCYLCPPSDVALWCHAIERALVAPEAKEKARRALAEVSEKFTWRARAERMLELFSGLSRSSKPAQRPGRARSR